MILFENSNAQIHLNKTNLATICNCGPMNSSSINLNYKKIETIDPDTFKRLFSLRELKLEHNNLSSIHPTTFKGLTQTYLRNRLEPSHLEQLTFIKDNLE